MNFSNVNSSNWTTNLDNACGLFFCGNQDLLLLEPLIITLGLMILYSLCYNVIQVIK